MLLLDFLVHASVLTHNRSRTLHRILLIIFVIGIGPVLLIMILVGSVNDSIDYSDLLCEGGCVNKTQVLSKMIRDLHLALLIISSLFGLASGILYIFFDFNASDQDLQIPLIFYSRYQIKPAEQFSECSICKEQIFPNERVLIIEICRHAYHKNCIREWFLIKKECPLCRILVAYD